MTKDTYFTGDGIGDYIYLYSGTKFYVNNPRSEDIRILDIAHSLSRIVRYTGHIERFYSVGEHSILCAELAKELGYDAKMQLYLLLHDACEGLGMNDVNSVTKKYLKNYKEMEQKIMDEVWKYAGLPNPTEEEYKVVKLIDHTLLINEMKFLFKHNDFPNVDYLDAIVQFGEEKNMNDVKVKFVHLFLELMVEVQN